MRDVPKTIRVALKLLVLDDPNVRFIGSETELDDRTSYQRMAGDTMSDARYSSEVARYTVEIAQLHQRGGDEDAVDEALAIQLFERRLMKMKPADRFRECETRMEWIAKIAAAAELEIKPEDMLCSHPIREHVYKSATPGVVWCGACGGRV